MKKKREKSVTFTDHKQVNPNQTFILTAYDLYDIFMEFRINEIQACVAFILITTNDGQVEAIYKL